MKFDPRKNMSSLNVSAISQSSANQRKGRAGRTSPGICYRLYSNVDYTKLQATGLPEILRIQVTQAMLKLLQLNVNPLEFDYVQSPPTEVMVTAMQTLKDLDNINDCGKITELGRWVARLPVDPRLGVMIKKGIDMNIPSETLVVASCCSQNSIFFRAGTQEEKKIADQKKLKFCQEGGDLVTMLAVYREWDKINEKSKGRWCRDNSINGKSMKAVRDMANEIISILRKEANLTIKHHFTNVTEANTKVKELIFDSMRSNLAYYLGHERAGYLVVKQNQRVEVHPSSALLALDLHPTWVVFNKVLSTSADFVTEVTPISNSHIEEAITCGKVIVDEDKLLNMKVERIHTFEVGRHVFWKFVGQKHQNRKDVEAKISEVCNDSLVVIDANKARGDIALYCVPMYGNIAADMMKEQLQPLPEQLVNERREEAITDRKGENVGVRAVLGKGGSVVAILMPEQFRSLSIKEKLFHHDRLTEQDLRDQLSLYGTIEQLWKSTGKKNANSELWGKVTFTNEADAIVANREVNDEEDSAFTLVPVTFKSLNKRSKQEITLKLHWLRRNSRGHCYVRPQMPIHVDRLLDTTVYVCGIELDSEVSRQDDSAVYFKGLPVDVMEEDVFAGIEDALNLKTGQGKSLFKVTIPRTNAVFHTDEIRNAEEELIDVLSDFADPSSFRVTVCPYGEKTVMVRAFATFSNVQTAEIVREAIEEGYCEVNGFEIQADVDYKSRVHVNSRIYNMIKVELEKITKRYRDSKSTSIDIRQLRFGLFAVDIKCKKLSRLAEVKVLLDETIRGDVLACGAVEGLYNMFTREGRQKVLQIERKTNTFIQVDERQMQLTIQGLYKNKCRAVVLISDEIGRCKSNQERELKLKGDDTPPGLLKVLYLKYGLKFDKLRRETGLSSISINMRHHEVTLLGSEDALLSAYSLVNEERQNLQKQAEGLFEEVTLPDCPVCLCPVEESEMHRLEYCGHSYCKPCLTNLITTAIDDRKFPITCAAGNCEQEIVIRDLNTQIKVGTVKRYTLAKNAIECFVQKNNDTYRFCLTPDCQMVYRVTADGERFACALCDIHICTTCNCEYHDGLICAMYTSARKDGNSVLQWMREDPDNRKKCPKCDFGIEKNKGCDHMECKCGAHICWKCMAWFKSCSACYGHLKKEHGSFV